MEQFDNYRSQNDYAPKKSISPFYIFLMLFCLVGVSLIVYAYKSGIHYTIQFNDGQIVITRDGSSKITPDNPSGSEVYVSVGNPDQSGQERAQLAQTLELDELAHQPAKQASNETGVKKCMDGKGRTVYQAQPCESTGLTAVKNLTTMDGAISTATYSYKEEQQRQAVQQEQPRSRPVQVRYEQVAARDDDYCQMVEERRENIRSQQRQRSTQSLRDQYRYWSDEYNSKCAG